MQGVQFRSDARMTGTRPDTAYTVVVVVELHGSAELGRLLFSHDFEPHGSSARARLEASHWTELGQRRRQDRDTWEREARLGALDFLLCTMMTTSEAVR